MENHARHVAGPRYGLTPIGIIRSPFKSPGDAPRQGTSQGAEGTIEVFQEYRDGLHGIDACTHLILVYWMDKARRDVLRATPPSDTVPRGVFSTRSPHRPNPIGLSVVELVAVHELSVRVRGLDAVDGTPVLDIKPYVAALDSVPDATINRAR